MYRTDLQSGLKVSDGHLRPDHAWHMESAKEIADEVRHVGDGILNKGRAAQKRLAEKKKTPDLPRADVG
jgi:hypothetical protein